MIRRFGSTLRAPVLLKRVGHLAVCCRRGSADRNTYGVRCGRTVNSITQAVLGSVTAVAIPSGCTGGIKRFRERVFPAPLSKNVPLYLR